MMIDSDKRIYLCRPNQQIITQLNGIDINSVNYESYVKDYDTLTFNVDRYISVNGKFVESNGYEQLDIFMELYLEDIGYFQMQAPSIHNDGQKEYKEVVAYSIEKEFEDKDWQGLKINTGEDDSQEMLVEGNIDELGFPKEYVVLYNPDKPDLSLIHLVLAKMPGWSVIDDDIDPLLWKVKLSFDEENINLYGFLTSVVGPKAECLFLFDTLHKRIKAISKHSIEYETNIFIGLRNLAQSIDISVEEDSVYTRFNVFGGTDGLNIRDVNYNDNRIFNLDYFLNDNYINSPETIEKVKNWLQYRDNHREEFIEISQKILDISSKMDSINLRVPNDGTNWDQWNDMTEEALHKNLAYYNALLTNLQVSVDDNPQYTTDSEGNQVYVPWKTADGKIDHERYLDLLYDMANGYGGYYTYYEIITYIIPNIETAIKNLGLPPDQREEGNKDYETNWDLYGIQELKNKQKTYENEMTSLKEYATPWEDLSPEDQAGLNEEQYKMNHETYMKYKGYIGDENTPGTILYKLKELQTEYDALASEKETYEQQQIEMVQAATMENEQFNFTEDEIILINTLFHDKDYQNDNIITTSIDTTLSTIEVQKTLYDDAVSKLSEVSQPQYSFETSLDNLLRLEEFKDWHDDLKLLRYIRLGVRDDFSVKLRVIGMAWNPCTTTPDLTLTFSNMITSKSGRSDLTELLSTENNRGSKNSISVGFGNIDDPQEFMTQLLGLLTQSQIFIGAVGDIASGTVGQIPEDIVQGLVNSYLKIAKIDVGQITGDEASFKKFFTDYMDADYIVGNTAVFKQASIDIANIETLLSGTVGAGEVTTIHLTSQNVTIDDAVIKELIAKHISVADLDAHAASAELITLISQNGDPSIAFFGSTQQFYDSNGNVRVQIGQDATGDFNFIIRGADGTTTLFDETGVKKDAIADGMIINDMLGDKSVTKRNMDWTGISEGVDENGNPTWDIANIYMNGEQFGAQYTTFVNSSNSKFTELDSSISNLSDMVESIELVGEQVFTESDGVISPDTITIDTIRKNGATVSKWYIDGVENTEYVSADKNSITIPSSFMANKKSVLIKVECADTAKYDVMSLYRVTDGSDAVTVILTSSAGNMFKPGSASTTTLSCAVYKGSEQIVPNSYAWYVYQNDTWTNLNLSSDSIEVNISDLSGIRNYKCVVDV